MKIKLQNKNGSVLLCFVVATLAFIMAGVLVYHIYRWAKRCDNGEPIDRPGVTNSDAIPTPGNGVGADITSLWWTDWYGWLEWWDEQSAMPLPEQPKIQHVELMVLGHLNEEGMLLEIKRQLSSTNSVTFKSLGMPVDECGFPYDFRWELNRPPGSSENWILERSTNMNDWSDVILWQVWPGITNGWIENDQAPESFYRVRKQ